MRNLAFWSPGWPGLDFHPPFWSPGWPGLDFHCISIKSLLETYYFGALASQASIFIAFQLNLY